MNHLFKAFLLSSATILVLGMSGCSDTEDTLTADPAGAGPDSNGTVSYVGTLTLDGTIDTSALSAKDQAETRSRSRVSRAGETELVKLYVVGADGEYTDTGIQCTVTSGSYTCPNIAGDKEYVVRYVKDLGNGRILEMKSSATVGTTSTTAVVSPVTTMIVETLVKAVQDSIAGVTGDLALISDIIERVKTAIVTTINSMVQTGAIKIPSLVVDGNFTAVQEETQVVEVKNTSLGDVAAIVTTSEAVSVDIAAVKSETTADTFSKLSASEKMKAVFDAIGWNEDMPVWVLEMVTDKYADMKPEWTFQWLLNNSTITPSPENQIDPDLGAKLGLSSADLASAASTVATSINQSFANGSVFNELKVEVIKYHTVKAKPRTERTDADKMFLSEFPSIVGEIFPSDFANSMDANTSMQNMAQMFLVLGYIDIYDGVIGERIKIELKTELANSVTYLAEVHNLVDQLFRDGGGQFILEAYTMEELSAYNYLYVGHGEASTQDMWDGSTSTNALRFVSMLSRMEWDLSENEGGMPAAEAANATAVLTYPKADGTTADVNLTFQQMDGHSFFGIMPMIANPDFNQSLGWTPDNQEWIENDDSTQIITDFVTGDYTVTFTYENNVTNVTETYSDTRAYYFIQNARDFRAELVNPKGQPQWKDEWNDIEWQNETNATLLAEMQAFNEANMEYWQNGAQAFAPNVDTSDDGVDKNDTLKGMIVKWNAPDLTGLTLPANIKVAYSVNVRLFTPPTEDTNNDGNFDWSDCGDNGQDCNQDIYSTWNDNKMITATSMVLPVDLAISEYNTTTGHGSNYELSIDVMFVNKDTGREIAHGGWSNAQFRVGETLELTGSELVEFKGDIKFSEWKIDNGSATLDTNMTVALFGETWGERTVDGVTEWFNERTLIATGEINTTNNTFVVDANWSQIESHIGNNKNIQIIGFTDNNGDGQFQDWDTATEANNWYSEPSHWMHDTWMNVENWGDTVIRTGSYNPETGEQSDRSIRLVKDQNVTVDGLSIMIW